jgi:MFS family permease
VSVSAAYASLYRIISRELTDPPGRRYGSRSFLYVVCGSAGSAVGMAVVFYFYIFEPGGWRWAVLPSRFPSLGVYVFLPRIVQRTYTLHPKPNPDPNTVPVPVLVPAKFS